MKGAATEGTSPAMLPDATPALRIEGELSIYRAAELKPLILAALDGLAPDGAATFDLSEVSEIDTAGVQLLLLARRKAASQGSTLTLAGSSPAVRSAFALLELDEHLAAA